MTNRQFSQTNKRFQAACELAEIKPTKRQASKYLMGKGKALAAQKSAGTEFESMFNETMKGGENT